MSKLLALFENLELQLAEVDSLENTVHHRHQFRVLREGPNVVSQFAHTLYLRQHQQGFVPNVSLTHELRLVPLFTPRFVSLGLLGFRLRFNRLRSMFSGLRRFSRPIINRTLRPEDFRGSLRVFTRRMDDGDARFLGRRWGILDDVLLEVFTLRRELEAIVFDLPNLGLASFPATKLLQAAVLFLQQAHTCQSLWIDSSTQSTTQSESHSSGDVEVIVCCQRFVLVSHSIEGHVGPSANETHTGSIGDT